LWRPGSHVIWMLILRPRRHHWVSRRRIYVLRPHHWIRGIVWAETRSWRCLWHVKRVPTPRASWHGRPEVNVGRGSSIWIPFWCYWSTRSLELSRCSPGWPGKLCPRIRSRTHLVFRHRELLLPRIEPCFLVQDYLSLCRWINRLSQLK
jgi:hypothetical protein